MARFRSAVERTNDRLTKRMLWARWRAAGCCGSCGAPVERFAKCNECRERYARRNLAWWHRQKAAA